MMRNLSFDPWVFIARDSFDSGVSATFLISIETDQNVFSVERLDRISAQDWILMLAITFYCRTIDVKYSI